MPGERRVNRVGMVANVDHDFAVREFSFDPGKPQRKNGREKDIFVDIGKPFGQNSLLQDMAQIASWKNRLRGKPGGFQPDLNQISEAQHTFLTIKRIISDQDDNWLICHRQYFHGDKIQPAGSAAVE